MSEQLLIGLVIGFAVAWFLSRRWRSTRDKETANTNASSEIDAEAASARTSLNKLYDLAEEFEGFLNKSAHPRDLLDHEVFQKGVGLLCHPEYERTELISYGAGDNLSIACMALEALNQRQENEKASEEAAEELIASINRIYAWPLFFALRALPPAPANSMIGAVLSQTREWWVGNPPFHNMIKPFVEERLSQGEVPTFDGRIKHASGDQLTQIENLLQALNISELKPLTQELIAVQRTLIDVTALFCHR